MLLIPPCRNASLGVSASLMLAAKGGVIAFEFLLFAPNLGCGGEGTLGVFTGGSAGQGNGCGMNLGY